MALHAPCQSGAGCFLRYKRMCIMQCWCMNIMFKLYASMPHLCRLEASRLACKSSVQRQALLQRAVVSYIHGSLKVCANCQQLLGFFSLARVAHANKVAAFDYVQQSAIQGTLGGLNIINEQGGVGSGLIPALVTLLCTACKERCPIQDTEACWAPPVLTLLLVHHCKQRAKVAPDDAAGRDVCYVAALARQVLPGMSSIDNTQNLL